MPTLAELKKLIKGHSTDKPKLSSGKEALLLYAEKVGLLQKKEEKAQAVTEVKSKLKSAPADLPDNLKKPVKTKEARLTIKEVAEPKQSRRRVVEQEEEPMSPKPKSSFSAFMSEHKGSGMSMTQLAEKYRNNKM